MSDIIFGPLQSRRFGQSLGIDLSPSIKQCNFDCVYCELKGAKPVGQMSEILSVGSIINALKKALKKYTNIDVITITANGEPTLYPYLDELVDEINKIKEDYKLLILTNGASIVNQNIRKILSKIDIVKLSLDCVTQRCFKKIDRPLSKINISDIISSMKDFRAMFQGSLIIEVLVVKGINDKNDEFNKISHILNQIKPDRVDIGTIDRPPAYKVEQVSMERLSQLADLIVGLYVSIAYRKDYVGTKRNFSKGEILNLILKRPQSIDDIKVSFDDESKEILLELLKKNIIREKKIGETTFYKR